MPKTLIRDMEERIVDMVIAEAIEAGYELRVNDGETTVTPRTTDKQLLRNAMFSSDEDYLFFYKQGEKDRFGYVFFVYGNDGFDVVSDYTLNLEDVMAPVNAFSNQYE